MLKLTNADRSMVVYVPPEIVEQVGVWRDMVMTVKDDEHEPVSQSTLCHS